MVKYRLMYIDYNSIWASKEVFQKDFITSECLCIFV